MKRYILLLLPFLSFAQLPDYYSYYEGIDFNLNGDALKQQLAILITTTHTNELEYTPEVWDALEQTDLDPDNPENVFLIYGYDDTDATPNNDRTRDKDDSCHTFTCTGLWVREHVFARSLGNPNLEYEGPGADAHNLRAIDSGMNSSRSNRPFTAGSGHSATVGSELFYPGDEWKGDVARMMMYMYVRYGVQCEANAVGSGSSSYSTFGDMPNIFLEWNQEDPVSQYEHNRNTILQAMQGNRNPFIDNPYIATKIWSGPSAEDTWGTLGTDEQPEIEQVFVYPTFTTGVINIEHASDNFTYIVYNSIGQKVNFIDEKHKINIGGNATGIYYVEICSAKNNKTFKVFLQ